MAKTRRAFSPAFKREAVALLETSGRPLMQVAMEVGISPSMLRNWRAVLRDGVIRSRVAAPGVPPLPSPADQASEITRLKRELDRTRMERDVLKNDRGSGPPVGVETARPHIAQGRERPIAFWWRMTSLKNMVHGLLRA